MNFLPTNGTARMPAQNGCRTIDADAKKNGITNGIVTLGAPLHVDVTADRAYVVVPANYKFQQKGKSVQETGSLKSSIDPDCTKARAADNRTSESPSCKACCKRSPATRRHGSYAQTKDKRA